MTSTPDLVLEVDVTSGSLNKLNIYAALGVDEIWRYDDKKLTILILDKTSLTYQKSERSLAFPWLDISKIPQFIAASLTAGETAALKSFRAWIREQVIP